MKCLTTGEAWVAWSKSLDKRWNSLSTQLRFGSEAGADGLLAVWQAEGADAFRYEVLEEIPEDNPHKLAMLLKDRCDHWRNVLGARNISCR